MTSFKYGTRDFYREQFVDYVTDITADDPDVTDNIINGFFDALKVIRDYHAATLTETNRALELATEIFNDTESTIQS